MTIGPFERETLLDLTVNAIPLGVLVCFLWLFVSITPWRPNRFMLALSVGLLVVPIVSLAFVSYISGLAIQRAEESTGSP